MSVRVPIVMDEDLTGPLDLFFQFCQMERMQLRIISMFCIQIAMRTIPVSHVIGPLRSQGNLNALSRIEYQQTKLSVKDVQVQYIIETGLPIEPVRSVVFLKGQPVSSQSVIVDVGEIMLGTLQIRNV